jgi:hypothetical protein
LQKTSTDSVCAGKKAIFCQEKLFLNLLSEVLKSFIVIRRQFKNETHQPQKHHLKRRG